MTSTVTPGSAAARTKKQWYRRAWIWIVVAAIAGISIGAASTGSAPDPKTSSEYKALAAKLRAADDSLALARQQIGSLPQEQASLKAAQDKLAADQSALAARQSEVSRREKAVSKAEAVQAANTIPGDGTYKVGADMNPGTYKSTDNAECYWQLSSDANGNDIQANNNVTGQAIISARAGQYFQSQGCSDWHKIG